MANLTITAANVQQSDGAVIRNAIARDTVTAGMVLNMTSEGVGPADTDTLVHARVAGIALNNAATGQPVAYVVRDGELDLGATLVVGETYVLGTEGAIRPIADVTTADFVAILGVASAANKLQFVVDPLLVGSVAAA